MSFRHIMLGAAAAMAMAVPAQAAVVLNAGFETGDLTDWTYTSGFVDVVTDADDAVVVPPAGEHFTATEGDYFAKLTANDEADVYTLLSQAFTLGQSSTLSFDAAFLAFDYLPYDDDAYVRVFSVSSNSVVFSSSVAAVGDLGHTSWASFTSGVLAAGAYTLEAGVRNALDPDDFYSSQLLLDNVRVAAVGDPPPPPVPEPGGWALMILGFGGAGAMLRRRRSLAPLAG